MSMDGDSSQSEDGDRLLVAEFALGLLEPDEHERMAERLARDPELRRELAFWQARFATLDHEFADAPPPEGVWQRVEQRLFPAPAAAPRRGLWESLAFWRGIAAAGFAAAVLTIGYTALVPRPLPTGQELVAALEAEGSNVKFVALYDARAGMVKLAAVSGDAVPDKDFELWAIKGGAAPVSMGVIKVGTRSDVVMTDAMKTGFGPGTVLAVTLERKGGSPTGAPQGPVVAKGAALPI